MGLTVVILTIAGVIWLQIALAAWQGPSAAPPGDNVAGPLNIGSDLQTKSGGLDIAELYFDGLRAEIDFDLAGPALIFDATNNGDWDMLLYESGLYIGSGENLYMGGGSIYDTIDNTVNIGENLDANGYVKGNSLCIGADCRTSWPASSSGDITAVNAGNGLTGGGSTGSVTLNVGAGTGITVGSNDVGVRYPSYSCSAGYSLSSINLSNGSKTCEKDDTGGSLSCITEQITVPAGQALSKNCVAPYQRTGCSRGVSSGSASFVVWANTQNGCSFQNGTWSSKNGVTICCKIQ